jgi:hypothetical protein
MMTKIALKKVAPGVYQGAHRGETIIARDESDGWSARIAGKHEARRQKTRREAVNAVVRTFDMAAIELPAEILAIQQRWANEIKAVAIGIGAGDLEAMMSLRSLRSRLETFETMFRLEAVMIEQGIKDLSDRARMADESAAIAEM